MKFYMVVDLKTHRWLPQSKGKQTKLDLTAAKPPRLFSRKSDATRAINCWMSGITAYTRTMDAGEKQRNNLKKAH